MFTMFLFLVDDWALSVPQVLHSYYLNSKYFEYTHYVMWYKNRSDFELVSENVCCLWSLLNFQKITSSFVPYLLIFD